MDKKKLVEFNEPQLGKWLQQVIAHMDILKKSDEGEVQEEDWCSRQVRSLFGLDFRKELQGGDSSFLSEVTDGSQESHFYTRY